MIVKESISNFKRGLSVKRALNLGTEVKIKQFIEKQNKIPMHNNNRVDMQIYPGHYVYFVTLLVNTQNIEELDYIDFMWDKLEPAAINRVFKSSLYVFLSGYFRRLKIIKWIELGRRALNDPRLNIKEAVKDVKTAIRNHKKSTTANIIDEYGKEIIHHPKINPLIKGTKWGNKYKTVYYDQVFEIFKRGEDPKEILGIGIKGQIKEIAHSENVSEDNYNAIIHSIAPSGKSHIVKYIIDHYMAEMSTSFLNILFYYVFKDIEKMTDIQRRDWMHIEEKLLEINIPNSNAPNMFKDFMENYAPNDHTNPHIWKTIFEPIWDFYKEFAKKIYENPKIKKGLNWITRRKFNKIFANERY